MTDSVLSVHWKWREEVPNVLRKRPSGRKRASAFGWRARLDDIQQNDCAKMEEVAKLGTCEGYRRNRVASLDRVELTEGNDGSYSGKTPDGSRISVYFDEGWCWEETRGDEYVDGEAGFAGIGSCIADMRRKGYEVRVSKRSDVISRRSKKSARRRTARVRMPKKHCASNNKRCRASSMTNLKTLKVGRCYVGVELSNGIAHIEIDGPEHSANMELDHTSYVYDRSEKYLSDQKREIFDAIRSSVKSCNNGMQLDNSEFMEISDCTDFIWDYFTSFHEDEIKMMQEDFMNSPYGSWFDYDKSKTSYRRSSTERVAMGNIKADDIVIERTSYLFGYVHSHGHIYIQDLPCLSFDVSKDSGDFYVSVWLSNPSSIYDSEEYAVWYEGGVFGYDEISEKLGVDDDDPYYSIYNEDAVKAAVSLLLDETSVPDDAWDEYYDLLDEDEDEYDASRGNARRRSTRGRMARKAPRTTRRNALRRKSAWNDGFGFNGDSAWMVWYDDFAIDCDADRMPDGTWRVVYTLMDPLDTDRATGLSRLGRFDVDLSGYEYEEDALRDFMEDNVPPVPQADRDRYSLRDTVGYIMNEYGRVGTIETREDVAEAYMSAYGNLPSDDELDEIVDCINDNYFVHISSRRPTKASSCRRPKGSVACNRSARNSMARRAGAHNFRKSMRKGAGFHNIPREFGGGWIETDEVEPGRWRARGVQFGEYATRAVYGRTEQEAVRKAVKEMQGYPEARSLTLGDVMGAEACRSASRRGAAARRSHAKLRASRTGTAAKSARARRIAAYGRKNRGGRR